jgi:hypothetical protein
MGSFAYNLSEAALCADDKNLKILMDAFPSLLNPDYDKFANEKWWQSAKVFMNEFPANQFGECGK